MTVTVNLRSNALKGRSDDMGERSSDADCSDRRTYTLYLIRHGEACHNVQEKLAKDMARKCAIAEGIDPDSPECKARMEEARKKILADPSFFDAPLSEKGKIEAQTSRRAMEQFIAEEGLPPPTKVLVSPLQRTLQTASLIFPDHSDVDVREELRERLTGRPADNRTSSKILEKRQSFEKFSFERLRLNSVLNAKAMRAVQEEHLEGEQFVQFSQSLFGRHGSSFNTDEPVEDEDKLRERTSKLFDLLAESDDDAVAVITHKGYLRGLERGAFGQADAEEFQNCEVRVYRATFCAGNRHLDSIQRLD